MVVCVCVFFLRSVIGTCLRCEATTVHFSESHSDSIRRKMGVVFCSLLYCDDFLSDALFVFWVSSDVKSSLVCRKLTADEAGDPG